MDKDQQKLNESMRKLTAEMHELVRVMATLNQNLVEMYKMMNKENPDG